MSKRQRVEAGLSALFVVLYAVSSFADEVQADAPVEPPFTISGRVTLPDGSPAAKARLTVVSNWPNIPIVQPVSMHCDVNGAFRGLTARFGFTTLIHAASADGDMQSELVVFDFMARTAAAKPFLIELKPVRRVRVTVTSGGKPVPACEVVIHRLPASRSSTDKQGDAVVAFPANCTSDTIVAFHPELGIGAWQRKKTANSFPETVKIQLAKPAKHEFVVLDQRGKPVAGFNIKAAVRLEDELPWASTGSIPRAHVRSDETGAAEVPWMPKNYRYIDAPTASIRWQLDERSSNAQTTILRVRKKHPFLGMVRFPDGKPRSGVLLVATSFGPKGRGDRAQARTDEKGKFKLYLAPDHAYALGVRDQEWASELRAGVLLRTKGDSVEYTTGGTILKARPATQVTVRVVDEDGEPMDATWVNFGLSQDIEWTNIDGKKRRGTPSIRHWLITDHNGIGRFGTLPGKLRIRATKHGWSKTEKIDVSSTGRVTVKIQRDVKPGE